MRLVADRVPPTSAAELVAGLVAGQTHLHSLGITSFQDACVGAAGELGMPDSFDTYLMAADYGMLSSHVVGALWWDRHRGLTRSMTCWPGASRPATASSGRPRSS